MTIIQLEYLLAVAKYGSFSTAAEFCNVTQPSLSTQIKNLEQELEVTIFNRHTKPIELTEAGVVVENMARKAIIQFNKIEQSVKEFKHEIGGVLRIAAIPTIAPYLLHRFVPAFIKLYPEIKLEVKELYTRDIIKAIEDDKLDIAIWAAGFAEGYDIIEEPLFDDPFYLYAASENPLLKDDQISVIDLDINSLLMLSDGHCLRTQILDICNSSNPIGSNLNLEGGSLETIMRMVDKSGTATIIPQIVADFLSEEKRANLRPFKEKSATKRTIAMATSRNFLKHGAKEALKEQILKNL